MVSKNSKGQVFIEMLVAVLFFSLFWFGVVKYVGNQKKNLKNWELGHETQSRFQKKLAR